jgi:hypothetical protein
MAKRVSQYSQGAGSFVGEPTIQNRNVMPTWLG